MSLPSFAELKNSTNRHTSHLNELMSVQFYEYLRRSRVGKNPKCDENDDGDYCAADGYLMLIDVWWLLRRRFVTEPPFALSELDLSKTYVWLSNGSHGSWKTFPSDITLKLTELQTHPRALELFGPEATICTDKQSSIEIRLFKRVGKGARGKIVPLSIDQLRKNEYSFAVELLESSTTYYIHPTEPILAFASAVGGGNAVNGNVPTIPGLTPYLYLALVCSDVSGGGLLVMRQLAILCDTLHVRFILLSALSHVIWYYYKQFGARPINRHGQLVDVHAYERHRPVPRRSV